MMPDVLEVAQEKAQVQPLRDVRIEDIIGRPSAQLTLMGDVQGVQQRRIMVTGAAGSIGSEICRELTRHRPTELILLDNNESGLFDILSELHTKHPELKLTPVLADVTHKDRLERIFARLVPEVIFHAAAYKHVPMLEGYPTEAVRVNIGGTRNVASLAQRYQARSFVLVSSDKAVNSSSVMGATKYICEKLVQALAQSVPQRTPRMTSVRFGNVVGSRGSVVPLFEKQIMHGGPITITDRRMTRYFMSIPEAAHLVIQAACLTHSDDIFLLEMGERVLIVELAERMVRLCGLRPHLDIEFKVTGLRPGEVLHENLLIPGETRHQTEHPYIFALRSLPVDGLALLQEVEGLLGTAATGEDALLREELLSLAKRAQQARSKREGLATHI
ncbi:MAG: polysaccharide biosynthesis protein [Anaerolineae bacterium]|nr:polysaccharide biosynthesis protein [Anaerolineae bacterium]